MSGEEPEAPLAGDRRRAGGDRGGCDGAAVVAVGGSSGAAATLAARDSYRLGGPALGSVCGRGRLVSSESGNAASTGRAVLGAPCVGMRAQCYAAGTSVAVLPGRPADGLRREWPDLPAIRVGAATKAILGTESLPERHRRRFRRTDRHSPSTHRANQTLKRIAVTGGAAVTICPAANPYGMSWGSDGIVFGQGRGGIMRVAAGRRQARANRGREGERVYFMARRFCPAGRTCCLRRRWAHRAIAGKRRRLSCRRWRRRERKTLIETALTAAICLRDISSLH